MHGLIAAALPPLTCTQVNFLQEPEKLINIVKEGMKGANPKLKVMIDIATNYMRARVNKDNMLLMPHHTQILIILIFNEFFEKKDEYGKKFDVKTLIGQVSTGEGKSIMLAMLAVFAVKHWKCKVHILENNRTLLDRDYADYEKFYKMCGVSSSKDLSSDAKIVYCLKKDNNLFLMKQLVEGELDLSKHVMLVDEVDDLIGSEAPNQNYSISDSTKTPLYTECFKNMKKEMEKKKGNIFKEVKGWESLHDKIDKGEFERLRPPGATDEIFWLALRSWCWAELEEGPVKGPKIEGTHYRKETREDGKETFMWLNAERKLPKVPRFAPWLFWLNFKTFGHEPAMRLPFCCMNTTFMFNQYRAIFGLSGSVGGNSELEYLRKHFRAVVYTVPLFLKTCDNARKDPPIERGFHITATRDEHRRVILKEVQTYFRKKVPVLLICRSGQEVTELKKVLLEAKFCKRDNIQIFLEHDEETRQRISEHRMHVILNLSTMADGTGADKRFRITLTDKFGGRGHDFPSNDDSNENGGMIVIATSVPDEREWIQWKGRTARQDKPGQVMIILCKEDWPWDNSAALAQAKKDRKDQPKPTKDPVADKRAMRLWNVANDRAKEAEQQADTEARVAANLHNEKGKVAKLLELHDSRTKQLIKVTCLPALSKECCLGASASGLASTPEAKRSPCLGVRRRLRRLQSVS